MENNSRVISQDEILKQNEYIQKVLELNAGRHSLAFVDTYGCQQNEADSEILRGMLTEMGYDQTQDEAEADVILINSCAVREHAEQRVLGNVGALVHTKRNKPDQLIGICGCMVSQEHMANKIKSSFRHVDMVFGVHALYRFPEILYRAKTTKKRIFEVSKTDGAIAEGLPVVRKSVIKAWVSVMYGCNNFCTYCIVPYVRGRERSRAPEAVISEIRGLIESGCRDVTLLGQNVNSYGKDLENGMDFSELLREINDIPGDFWIRFMTSHPKDATPRLFQTMASCKKVAKHIHLPFQSGNDDILRAMNRKYDREHYMKLINLAREDMPDISLTSDIIVGFPGETEEDFNDTLRLVKDVKFDALFTFIYSKRKGTPAAEMADDTTRSEKLARFDRLLALQNEIAKEKNLLVDGKTVTVLIEAEQESADGNLLARTQGNRPVHLKGDPSLVGSFVSVRIHNSEKWGMRGELV